MQIRLIHKTRDLLWYLLFAAAGIHVPATAQDVERLQETDRLQELLYGEALFLSQQQDYLAAISKLQIAEAQGLLSPTSDDARLLLARLKLAYGLHLEAGFDFHGLLGEEVPEPVRNRAWYELARIFFQKGYTQAAVEALESVRGEVPADIVGDYQLLRATVLMSLDRDREAAQELAQWRGAPTLAAYAHYNRGMALVRAGDYPQAASALQQSVAVPARGEELLALRDKARLSLGYVFAREENYKQARKQLEAIRPQGPFSNRALLALGWIDHKQGRSDDALVSWTELRDRSPSDPAVLETLLLVPAVHRDLDALPSASRDYEAAITAYGSELNRLRAAKASVQQGQAVSLLLQEDSGLRQNAEDQSNQETTRFLGSMMASRGFQEMRQSHDELQAMLEMVDRDLQEMDVLAKAAPRVGPVTPGAALPVSPIPVARKPAESNDGSHPTPSQDASRNSADPQVQQEWIERRSAPTDHPAPGIPQLPEIESPKKRTVKPLPGSGVPRSRPVPRYNWKLPKQEITGLPVSEIIWLPTSGEFFNRPSSGEFFRRPGEEEVEDYAYPDELPRKQTPRERYGYKLNLLLPAQEPEPGFDPGAVPVGEALRQLAAELNKSKKRMAQLGELFDPASETTELQARINALRARILQLRRRIANAITLYEDYTRALALDELDRRQRLLEDLLEQANLELAKTYDQSSDR